MPAFSGPSEEVLAAYRLMGLDLDATYDEIEKSFDELLATYTGEPKKKIKLQVAKDKILEDRLRQRMAGGLAGFTGVADPFDVPDGPKPLITIPPRLQGIMELSDKETAIKNAVVFGILAALPLATVQWASTSVGMGFAVSMFLLYNRGVPDAQPDEMRPPKAKPLIMAAGFTLGLASVGATVVSFVLSKILRGLTAEFLAAFGACLGFYTAATLFKVQDEY